MSYIQAILILVLYVSAYSGASNYYLGYENYNLVQKKSDHDHHYVDYDDPPHYSYEYNIHAPHTGDIKSQHESREGDVVKGYYKVKEADGTEREVHYTADKHNGFNAVVKTHGTPKVYHQPVQNHHQNQHDDY